MAAKVCRRSIVRFVGRVRQDLRDDVRIALPRQPLDEIPVAEEGAHAQYSDSETADEEW